MAGSRAVCINLDRSADRWKQFQSGLTSQIIEVIGDIERVSAFTPDLVPTPKPVWLDLTGPSWACYQSHMAQIELAIRDDVDELLILEDDAIFDKDFVPLFSSLMMNLPRGWDLIYLGGIHKAKPYQIHKDFVQCRDTTLHHAWALSRSGMRKVCAHLGDLAGLRALRGRKPNKDQWVAQGIRMRRFTAYGPRSRWLVHQRAGRSDRNNAVHAPRYGLYRTCPTVKWPPRS